MKTTTLALSILLSSGFAFADGQTPNSSWNCVATSGVDVTIAQIKNGSASVYYFNAMTAATPPTVVGGPFANLITDSTHDLASGLGSTKASDGNFVLLGENLDYRSNLGDKGMVHVSDLKCKPGQ